MEQPAYITTRYLLALLIITLFSKVSYSQNLSSFVQNSGGGTLFINPDLTFDWSIGETTVIDTYTCGPVTPNSKLTSKLFFTCGFLQPFNSYRILTGNTLEANRFSLDDVRIYPVPIVNQVTVDVRSYSTGILTVTLMDVNGAFLKSVTTSSILSPVKQVWNMPEYKPGTYFFSIQLQSFDKASVLKTGTFKVIKL